MKNFKKIILTGIFLAAAPLSALAQSDYYGISSFEGFYAGAYGGAMFDPNATATAGGIAGVNFVITDSILAGLEVQGGAAFDTPTTTYDALMLGRVGYEINDMIMLYGAGGAGLINGATSYAVGGGAEVIVVDNVGVRAEALGTGAWGAGLSATKMSLGVVFHVQ